MASRLETAPNAHAQRAQHQGLVKVTAEHYTIVIFALTVRADSE